MNGNSSIRTGSQIRIMGGLVSIICDEEVGGGAPLATTQSQIWYNACMKAKGIKKVTLESVSRQVRSSFEGAKKHTDTQVEGLARIVRNGFSELKTDLKDHLVSKKEFSELREVVLDQFRLLNADIKSINTTLGPTVVIVAQ